MLRRIVLVLVACGSLGVVPAAASAEGSCPNEAFRVGLSAALPECRAYEMVSPLDKNNYDVRGDNTWTRSSIDGNALTYSTVGPIPNTGQVGTLSAPQYLVRRGTSAWTTSSIDPPHDSHWLSIFAQFMDLVQPPAWFASDLSQSTVMTYRNSTGLAPDPEPFDPNREVSLFTHNFQTGAFTRLTQAGVFALPLVVGVSADHTHVLFHSPADLTPNATGTEDNLYEADHGTLRLVGILPNGEPAANSYPGVAGGPLVDSHRSPHSISEDGQRIAFTTAACGFAEDPRDCPPNGPLYLRDGGGTPSARTLWINESEKTVPDATQPALFRDMSADGSKVFFTSAEQLVNADTNTTTDLYMYDLSAPEGKRLTLISRDEEPADPGGPVAGVLGVSRDGSRVYFAAEGQLVAGATTGEAGGAHPSRRLYLWQGGILRYIKTLETGLAFGPQGSQNWNLEFADYKSSRVSDDGRFLLFTAGQTNSQIYLYDAETDHSHCISCPSPGVAETGGASIGGGPSPYSGSGGSYEARALVDVGGHPRVFFETPQGLVPRDTNGLGDVYEYNDDTGSLSLISTGRGTQDAWFLDASPDAHDIFFTTDARLSPWDSDDLMDVYDARVGGGLPGPPVLVPCDGEGCQGSASAPPVLPGAASTAVSGTGNTVHPPRDESLRVVSRPGKHRGATTTLRLAVPTGGRLSWAGRGLKAGARPIAGTGTWSIPLALTRAARDELRRHHQYRVAVRLTFRSAAGRTTSITERLTFTEPTSKRKGR